MRIKSDNSTDTVAPLLSAGYFLLSKLILKCPPLTHLLIELTKMWTLNTVPVPLCLRTAAAIQFVTSFHTGISYQGTSADDVKQSQNISEVEDTLPTVSRHLYPTY